jgi:NTP pyrophosphatase (non-canonical NTP hydrolase)
MDEFVRRRGWYAPDSPKPQTPRNLSVSLAIEAAELLECFQWREEADPARVADELADVILYAVQIANVMDIAIDRAVAEKLRINGERTWE